MSDQEYQERKTALSDLFTNHEELHAAFHEDATVHAWFTMFLRGHYTLIEAYLGIIANLVREKKTLFDANVKMATLQPPTPIVVPRDWKIDERIVQPMPDGVEVPPLKKGSKVVLSNFGKPDGTYVITGTKGDSITLERQS